MKIPYTLIRKRNTDIDKSSSEEMIVGWRTFKSEKYNVDRLCTAVHLGEDPWTER